MDNSILTPEVIDLHGAIQLLKLWNLETAHLEERLNTLINDYKMKAKVG